MESTPNPYASPAGELPASVRAMLVSSAGRHARYESAQPRARRVVFFFYAAMFLLPYRQALNGLRAGVQALQAPAGERIATFLRKAGLDRALAVLSEVQDHKLTA